MFGHYYYGYYMDPTYILVLIGFVLCMIASMQVNSTYRKYAKVHNRRGLTGAQAAEEILRNAGIYDVGIEHISGNMTDNYDPRVKVLHLSDSTYHSTSVAAIGIAAHECGHAIQHDKEYLPIRIRKVLLPVANIGSRLGVPLIIVGLIFGLSQTFIQVGIWMFALAVLFQLVTLPVEFNASNRAISIVSGNGMLYEDEVSMCKKVLGAAAMTYVAAAASSMLQLLRLVLLFGGRGGRRRD